MPSISSELRKRRDNIPRWAFAATFPDRPAAGVLGVMSQLALYEKQDSGSL